MRIETILSYKTASRLLDHPIASSWMFPAPDKLTKTRTGRYRVVWNDHPMVNDVLVLLGYAHVNPDIDFPTLREMELVFLSSMDDLATYPGVTVTFPGVVMTGPLPDVYTTLKGYDGD